jgi:hypothetical protein
MDLNFFSNKTLQQLSKTIPLEDLKKLNWWEVEHIVAASIKIRRQCTLYEKAQLEPDSLVDFNSIEVAETQFEFHQIW